MTEQPKSLIPPLRFATVYPGIYRGSYPREVNHRFLQRLKIKTILSLVPKGISEETDKTLYDFAQNNGIQLVHVKVEKGGKGKKRAVPVTSEIVDVVLSTLLESSNSPVYMHCLNGGYVTSLVVACFRKLFQWTKVSIFNEFIVYSDTLNVNDREFVEKYYGEIRVENLREDEVLRDVFVKNPFVKLQKISHA